MNLPCEISDFSIRALVKDLRVAGVRVFVLGVAECEVRRKRIPIRATAGNRCFNQVREARRDPFPNHPNASSGPRLVVLLSSNASSIRRSACLAAAVAN